MATSQSSHTRPDDDNRLVDSQDPRGDDQALSISRFTNKKDTRPQTVSLTWPDLVGLLGTFTTCKDKGGALWSPVTYRRGHKRGNPGVEAVSALVADVDDGTPLEVLVGQLGDLEYVVHSTFSHTPEYPKLRVVVCLSEPIPAEQYGTVRAQADLHLFAGHHDKACPDAARMYYWPQMQPGTTAASHHHAGKPLDWRALPPLPPAPIRPPRPVRANLAPPTRLEERRARKMLEKWRGDLANTQHGQRHDRLFDLAISAGGLVASGLLDEANVRDVLYDGALACGLVDEDGSNVDRTLDDGLRRGALKPWRPDDLAGSWRPEIHGTDAATLHVDNVAEVPDNVVELQQRLKHMTARVEQLEDEGHVIDSYLDKRGMTPAQRLVAIKTMRASAWLLDRKPTEQFTPNTQRIERETGVSRDTINATYRVLVEGGIFKKVPGWWPSGRPKTILKPTNTSAASAAEVFAPPIDFLTEKQTRVAQVELAESYPPDDNGHPARQRVVTTVRREHLVCAEGEAYEEHFLSSRRRVIHLVQAHECNACAECKGRGENFTPRVRMNRGGERDKRVVRVVLPQNVVRVVLPQKPENWQAAERAGGALEPEAGRPDPPGDDDLWWLPIEHGDEGDDGAQMIEYEDDDGAGADLEQAQARAPADAA